MSIKKRLALLVCFGIGVFLLVISLYQLVAEVYFVYNAKVFDAAVVEVRRDLVSKGKGSTLAYVPIVEITDETGRSLRIKVESFSEEPVYQTGDRIQVLCNLSSMKCIQNNFVQKWGNFALTLVLSLVFLSIPLFYYRRVRPFDTPQTHL